MTKKIWERPPSDQRDYKTYNSYCMGCGKDGVLTRREVRNSPEDWRIIVECKNCGIVCQRPQKFNRDQQGMVQEGVRDLDTYLGISPSEAHE